MVMICYLSIGGKLFVTQIQRKLKRKRKQKRNRGGHLRGGAKRPSRRLPCFCFRFRFNLRLIFRMQKIGANVSWLENERKTTKQVCENENETKWLKQPPFSFSF